MLLRLDTLRTPESPQMAFNGSLNKARAVYPPSSRVAAIPDETAAIAIIPFERSLAHNKFISKVFPVLPGAFKKKMFPNREQTLARTAS